MLWIDATLSNLLYRKKSDPSISSDVTVTAHTPLPSMERPEPVSEAARLACSNVLHC